MHLQGKRWAINENKLQSPGLTVKFLRFVWLGKTKVMPVTVIDKIQAFPLSQLNNCRSSQVSWDSGGFLFHPQHSWYVPFII